MSILIYFATIFWSLFPNLIHVFQGGDDLINKVNETNLVVNSDFTNGTTSWISFSSTSSVSNSNLFNTSTGLNNTGAIYQEVLPLVDTIYIFAKIRVFNDSTDYLRIRSSNLSVQAYQSNPFNGQWYFLSAVGVTTNPRFEVRHEYIDSVTANGKIMEVDYAGTYNVSDMITKGIKNDDGVLFSDLTNEEIRLQLDGWITDYGDLDFAITKDNTADRWFNTGFVEKTAERDFIDYLGYFFWLFTPPIMLFITLDLIRRLL